MYHVSAQGIDERLINVHHDYYYYYYKTKELFGNLLDILNTILGHKYHQNYPSRVLIIERVKPKFATKSGFITFVSFNSRTRHCRRSDLVSE